MEPALCQLYRHTFVPYFSKVKKQKVNDKLLTYLLTYFLVHQQIILPIALVIQVEQ